MIYKLFLFGQKDFLAYIEADPFLKEGDLFYFNSVKYKILRLVKHFHPVTFDATGKRLFVTVYSDKETATDMIITEIPEV